MKIIKQLKRKRRLNKIKSLRKSVCNIQYSNKGRAREQILNLKHLKRYQSSTGLAYSKITLTVEGGWELTGTAGMFVEEAMYKAVMEYYKFFRNKYLSEICS